MHRLASKVCFLSVIASVVWLAGCASRPEQPTSRSVVRVMSCDAVRPLLVWCERVYEQENPTIDIALDFGQKDAGLDRTQVLIEKIAASGSADVFIAEHAKQFDALPGVKREERAWLVNRIFAVTARDSRLRMIDLSRGSCQIGVALERTPLGRLSRLALDRRGLWSTVSDRVGRFDDSDAICEVVRHSSSRGQEMIGIVYASDTIDAGVRVIGELELPEDESATHVAAWFTSEGGRFAEFLLSDQVSARAAGMGLRPAPR